MASPGEFTVFSHRGLNEVAPENTLVAFEMAADAGATWIETDVDLTRDSVAVIIHDDTLDRTTDAVGAVAELVQADLDGIDAGSWFGEQFTGTKLPLLSEVIEFMNRRGVNANLELKLAPGAQADTAELVEVVVKSLGKLDPGREVLISSFSEALLQQFHAAAPQYRIGLLVGGDPRGMWQQSMAATGASSLHPKDAFVDEALVVSVKKAGYDVFVWTVNDSARAKELRSWGVDGVFTDVADRFSGGSEAE